MKLTNGKLQLETRDDVMCGGTGSVPGRKPCAACRGTGRGNRGKARGCRACYGSGTVADFANKVPCTRCNATGIVLETIYDYAPDSIWQGFSFVVNRENRRLTWMESYLAHSNVFSCTDYGSAWENPDDSKIIEQVKTHKGHQACKFTKEDGTVADHININVVFNGYTVDAICLKRADVVSRKELVA